MIGLDICQYDHAIPIWPFMQFLQTFTGNFQNLMS